MMTRLHHLLRWSARLAACLLLAVAPVAVPALLLGTQQAHATQPTPAPTPAGLAVHLSDEHCAWLGLAPTGLGHCLTPAGVPVVAISAPDDDQPEHPGVELLATAGYTGEAGDGMSAIYAPTGVVLFDETGTWTVTLDGLARCEHGADRPCTGWEWLH